MGDYKTSITLRNTTKKYDEYLHILIIKTVSKYIDATSLSEPIMAAIPPGPSWGTGQNDFAIKMHKTIILQSVWRVRLPRHKYISHGDMSEIESKMQIVS